MIRSLGWQKPFRPMERYVTRFPRSTTMARRGRGTGRQLAGAPIAPSGTAVRYRGRHVPRITFARRLDPTGVIPVITGITPPAARYR